MRKYLDKKAEIETDFQNKADALIDWLRGEYARIAVYRSDVQHEERKKIVEKYEARIGALRTQYIDMEVTMFQNAIAEFQDVMTMEPTGKQLSYLQVLSLTPGASKSMIDLKKAWAVARGNAVSESAVYGMASQIPGGSEAIIAEGYRGIDIDKVIDGVERFAASRAKRIEGYGDPAKIDSTDNWGDLLFMPGGSCSALDDLDWAIDRYSFAGNLENGTFLNQYI